jgi:cytochrome b pre-mRNA-processing protein 3
MIFKRKKHNSDLYNTLLLLSRNIFFYKDLNFNDSYETRIYLMFFHYSVILLTLKLKGVKPDQTNYNNLFFHIENNLRELGFGDVSVNKKMKDLNKIFYDILIKLKTNSIDFEINKNLSVKYFENLSNNDKNWLNFSKYFTNFYLFCFELDSNSVIKDAKNFKLEL